jgi:hypothetical protein
VTGKGKHKNLLKPKLKPTLHNAFAILSQPDDHTSYKMSGPTLKMDDDKTILPPDPREHRRQRKIAQRQHIKQTLQCLRNSDNMFLDNSITLAEDKQTSLAKANKTNKKRMAINAAHTKRGTTSIGLVAQCGCNAAYSLGSAFNRTIKNINKNMHASFTTHPIMVTYDSGANGHYISEKDRHDAGLPILRPSPRKVGVTNGGTSTAKYVTQLPFQQLSARAMQADTFQDFPTSLMSVGKTADDGSVSVFTKEGVNVFKEEDVLITCKGEPILIGVRDSHGQYQIPLMQQRGQ